MTPGYGFAYFRWRNNSYGCPEASPSIKELWATLDFNWFAELQYKRKLSKQLAAAKRVAISIRRSEQHAMDNP